MSSLVVLITVFQNKPGLHKSLRSLVSEYERSLFDVLVVDDSSEPELEKSDFDEYPFKVYLLTNGKNRGITYSANRGLDWIKSQKIYSYIARLDAGDEVINGRFSKQLLHLNQHTDCVLVGGAIEYVTTGGKSLYVYRPPATDAGIRRQMHVNSCLCQPAIMMRAEAVFKVGGYRSYLAAEDYDLFWRMLKVGKAANLEDVVIRYEVSDHQISLRKRRSQLRNRLLLQLSNFDLLLFESYYGVMKSGVAFLLPWRFIIYLKSILNRVRAPRLIR